VKIETIQQKGGQKMNSVLFGQVTKALKKNSYLDFSTMTCETEKDRVVLRGVVPSYFEKQMAQESLRSIEGIGEILNELEVLKRPHHPFFSTMENRILNK
jgi:osmotically-inducible protein OsmY